ncbi:hypothetical protein NESM_000342500 [Novymonas esmeraldas]|uniref:Uncharacterized protein n=1 Tax=Novymonas esmeraldas TaxID=1808958 RepID=A0AAW0EJG4_9TRYP
MPITASCVPLCAPFTSMAALLLFMMAHMLRSGNLTFEVLAAKHGWEKEAKASTCVRGGMLYLVASVILWVTMCLHAPVQRLWMQLPWNRKREVDRPTREALLHQHNGRDCTAADNTAAWRVDSRRGTRSSGGGGAARSQHRGGGGDCEGGAMEMSALGWAVDSPATRSPVARRFPDFHRSLANGTAAATAGAASDSVSPPTASAVAGDAAARTHPHGLRSRGAGHGAASVVTLFPSEAESGTDSEFMSDVEVDGTRHYSSPQMRASGWRQHRTPSTSGPAGVQGRGPSRMVWPATTRGARRGGGEGRNGTASPPSASPSPSPVSRLTSLWTTDRPAATQSPPTALRAADSNAPRAHLLRGDRASKSVKGKTA